MLPPGSFIVIRMHANQIIESEERFCKFSFTLFGIYMNDSGSILNHDKIYAKHFHESEQ